jgi:hypothetical protein
MAGTRTSRLGSLQATFEPVHLVPADLERTGEFVPRCADLPPGPVDASATAVAERVGVHRGAAFDRRHPDVVRSRHAPALRPPP